MFRKLDLFPSSSEGRGKTPTQLGLLERANLNHWTTPESESYITIDGQSASLFWNKAPIWGLWPDFYYCQPVAVLLMLGALSDERMGLSFTLAAGPHQRSHSPRVLVPWDSQSYFTVSHSRVPLLSPPATHRVFEPASIWDGTTPLTFTQHLTT
jgi:hypothetical protein